MSRSLIWIILACWLLPASADARDGDKAAAELNRVVNGIRSLKTYSYKTDTDITFPDGTKETQRSELYMDMPGKRLYYTSSLEEYLVTPEWAVQLNHADRTAGLFRKSAYSRKHGRNASWDAYFDNRMMDIFLDSVLLKQVKVRTAPDKGDSATLFLDFPDYMSIRAMVITYSRTTGMPVLLRMRVFYPDSRYPMKDGRLQGTTHEIYCHQYNTAVPDHVFDTGKLFTVRGGSAELRKYRDYKLEKLL